MTKKVPQFKLLSDQPLTGEEKREVQFGHEAVASSLARIVRKAEPPFTIGLFGDWGSGKTTIVNLLRTKWDPENRKTVYFDVWKYEKDSLRRQLLWQTAVDSGLDENFLDRLEKEIYFSKKEKIGEKFDISWRRLFKVLLYSLPLIAIPALIIWAFYPNPLSVGALILSQWITIGVFFDRFVSDELSKIIKVSPIVGVKSPLDSPELFERAFSDILKNQKKTLIIVDNLDRTPHKKAVELLSTIKTFLETQPWSDLQNKKSKKSFNTIFLIPCDADAVKQHLKSVYLKNGEPDESFDPDEFLRKFFNAGIWIPQFIESDLRMYSERLLRKTGEMSKLINNEDVIQAISSAFTANPREIKQFINTLISNLVFALKSEVSEIVKENIGYLTKVLIIRQRFPKAYAQLRERWFDPEDIENKEENKKGLHDFLFNTGRITVSNAEPFLYFKRPVEEACLTDPDSLILALVKENRDDAERIIKKDIKQRNGKKSLGIFIQSLLKRYKDQESVLASILSTNLEISHGLKISFPDKQYYERIAQIIDQYLWPRFHQLPTSIVFSDILSQPTLITKFKKPVLDRYISILNLDKKQIDGVIVQEILKNLIQYKDLTRKQKEQIRVSLESKHFDQSEILGVFSKPEDQKEFITKALLTKFISEISHDDLTNLAIFNQKVQLLIKFSERISKVQVVSELTQKITEVLQSENDQGPQLTSEKKQLLLALEKILERFKDSLSGVEKDKLNVLVETIIQGLNAVSDWNQKKIFVRAIIWFEDYVDDTQKSNIKTTLEQFFQNCDHESLSFVLEYWTDETKASLIEEYSAVFEPRIISDENILQLIYFNSNKKRKSSIVNSLIQQRSDFGLPFIGKIEKKLPDRKEVLNTFLERAKGLEPKIRVDIYEYINRLMKKNDPSDLKEKAIEQIKNLLMNDDETAQETGYSFFQDASYLTQAQKRSIGKEIVEWLRQPGRQVSHTYRFAMKSVAPAWSILQVTPKRDFVYTVFSILQSSYQREDLTVGFEVLGEIRPKYTEFQKDFDDLRERIKSESNEEIRNYIQDELKKLKQKRRLSKKEQSFWRSVGRAKFTPPTV